jgi:hypothetical protein
MIRSACEAAAVILLVLIEFFCGVLTGAGAGGFFLTFLAAPLVVFVRTPRSWVFLTSISGVLALVPVLITAIQLRQPFQPGAGEWISGKGWTPLAPPSLGEIVIT